MGLSERSRTRILTMRKAVVSNRTSTNLIEKYFHPLKGYIRANCWVCVLRTEDSTA